MIKVEAIKDFTLERFDEITNLKRKYPISGKLLKAGDTFECKKDLLDYLMGNNDRKIQVVTIIEIIPDKKSKK